MSLILHIDTASSTASVSIAKEGRVIQSIENKLLNEHAAFLQPSVKKLLDTAGFKMKDIDAIAVANGPGSYTGLRVGLASAKGFCYALDKPLITIGTLPLMAHAACYAEQQEDLLYAPMIDARRMEVFTAVYDYGGKEKLPPAAKILYDDSYVALLLQHRILFFGSGAEKWKAVCKNANALFSGDYNIVQSFAQLSLEAFLSKSFTELAYSEPQYLKEFYTGK